MATERIVIGQAQRILVDATNKIWHKISTWTHASDVEMPNGDPLNVFLTDMNDDLNDKLDGKYNSYNIGTTGIASLDAIPEIGYSRIQTLNAITAGEYTLPANHYCYCYSGKDSNSIEKMAVMIDTTDLTSIVMYIAHYSIEARWTLTKIATQKQIDNLQMQIDNLNQEFNELNLFVQTSMGTMNAWIQVLQNQMDWLEAELAELQEQLNDLLNELRDFKNTVNAKFGEIDKIFKGLYGEVGSIYLTTTPTINGQMVYEFLEEHFGGKWVLVQDAYLYAGHFTGHDDVPDDYIGNSAMITKPAEDNYTKMRNWKNVFSPESSASFKATMTDRMARNYSQIYQGVDEFKINFSNLPQHTHNFDTDDLRTRISSFRVKDVNDFSSYFINERYIKKDAIGGKDDGYRFGTYEEEKLIVPGQWLTTTGYMYKGKDNPDSIKLNPTRFKVYVWCKIS